MFVCEENQEKGTAMVIPEIRHTSTIDDMGIQKKKKKEKRKKEKKEKKKKRKKNTIIFIGNSKRIYHFSVVKKEET